MALIVFTHGLGASRESWGSTIDTLSCHKSLTDHKIRVWEYRTNRRPEPRVFGRKWQMLRGWRRQGLTELGEQLWSNLRTWSDGHDEVVLVGHSMGGLVNAAALVHGDLADEDRDGELNRKVRGLICIASPFAGATSAEGLSRLHRHWGKNQHVADLRPKSATRKKVVQDFTRFLDRRTLVLVLMRAADDAYVSPGEITGPFSRGQYREYVLAGKHNECIENLQRNDENVAKLIDAIDDALIRSLTNTSAPYITWFSGRSVTMRREYDKRLDRMEGELDVLGWGLASFREDYRDNIAAWVERGVRVRLLLVDPHSDPGKMLCSLQDRIEKRRVGDTANDVLTFLQEMSPREGTYEVRTSQYHPGVNIFRIDSEMFFGPYLADKVSRNAPTGIVSHNHWLYERLLHHFEWMWDQASAWESSSGSESV